MNSPWAEFDFNALPNRVLFGAGRRREVASEVGALGCKRALIVATESQRTFARSVADMLGDKYAGTHSEAVQHVPYHTIEAVVAEVERLDVDILIALGGGSAIGLAKGVALERRQPILAIPTTYSGSEMTHIWGISRDGRKTTGRDPIVKPRTVIYDPELIVTLPAHLSLTSGINAMAHAVEALYAYNTNPIVFMMAEESVRALAVSLPKVVANPASIEARSASLYGAWLGATVLDQVAMSLHHKLCHTLGGSFGMPHAQTHTVMLPYAIAYNFNYAQDAMQALARALDCDFADVPGVVQDIARNNHGPTSLRELGFEQENLDKAAETAAQNPYANPRPVKRKHIRELLEQAFRGVRPHVVVQ